MSVFLFRRDAVQEPPGHSGQAVLPGLSFSFAQQLSVVMKRFEQADGGEYGGAVPGTLRVVIHAAVVANHVFAPGEQTPRPGQVLFLPGSVRHEQQRVQRAVRPGVELIDRQRQHGLHPRVGQPLAA